MKKILGLLFLAVVNTAPIYGDNHQYLDDQQPVEKRQVVIPVSTSGELTTAIQTAAQNTSESTEIVITGALAGNFTIPQSYQKITLLGQGSGASLSASNNGTTLIVSYGANVKIQNLTITGGHTATTLGLANTGYGIFNQGSLEIIASTIQSNNPGGIYNWGSLDIENSVLESNNSGTTAGTGISSVLGNVTVNQSTITNHLQYGIYMDTGVLSMNDTEISNTGNNTISTPCGLYLLYGVGGTISNCTINNTIGESSTYGIITYYSGIITMKNCTISGTTGYGIYNEYGSGITTITDSTLSNNTGYGIYNYYSAGTNLKNCIISGNTLGGISSEYAGTMVIKSCEIENNGYGINVAGTVLSVKDSNIENNTSTGIYSDDYNVIAIEHSSLIGNLGGGIYNSYSEFSIHRSHIHNNSSTTLAGGLHNTGEGLVSISHCDFQGNSSTANGGAIYNNFQMTIDQCTIAGNTCTGGTSTTGFGGGIYNDNYLYAAPSSASIPLSTLIINDSKINNNTSNKDGGGLFNLGIATLKSTKVQSNTAVHGGGIANETTNPSSVAVTGVSLTLLKSRITNNTATASAPSGGGVYNAGSPTFTEISSEIANNSPDQIAT